VRNPQQKNSLEDKVRRVRQAINLQRPDRMPFSGDWGYIEYRKEVYHLGEPELVAEIGEVVTASNGKRKYTKDGGVWDVGDKERYQDDRDVLSVDEEARFEVEDVGPAMLAEMARLYMEKATACFAVPLHYGTLVTRAVIEFGWEPFLLAAASDPKRLGEILDRFGEATLAVIEGWTTVPSTALITVHDDIAGTKDVFLHPSWYHTYAFPWYQRIFRAIHAKGRKVLYISDGNYMRVLDDILETEPDGLYIETTSMDPETFMRRAGKDKFYMIKSDSRNVDIGTPAEIREELRKLRALHQEFPGILMYRGGGNPRPGNKEAFERYYNELLVYESQ
jgi:hypothetical protein